MQILAEKGEVPAPTHGLRWTRISTSLVDAAALKAAHEEFEEEMSHVVVFRVLSRGEVEKLALQTHNIRGMFFVEETTSIYQAKQQKLEASNDMSGECRGNLKIGQYQTESLNILFQTLP